MSGRVVAARRRAILDALQRRALTAKELHGPAVGTAAHDRTRNDEVTLRNDLRYLEEAGLIRRVAGREIGATQHGEPIAWEATR